MSKHIAFHQHVRDFFSEGDHQEETYQSKRACAEAIAEYTGLDLSDFQIRRMATEVGRVLKDIEKTDEILVGRIPTDIMPASEEDDFPDLKDDDQNYAEFDEQLGTGKATFKFKGKLDEPITLDALIEQHGIDLEVYEVDRIKCNAWGMTAKMKNFVAPNKVNGNWLEASKNYQITAWFKRKAGVAACPTKALDGLLEKYSAENGDYRSNLGSGTFPAVTNEVLAVVNTYDSHIDKIALESTTGESATLEDNLLMFNTAFSEIVAGLEAAQPEKIVYPLGNDLYHTNDFTGKTKRGTQLEALAEPYEAYQVITEVAVDTVKRLSEIAPVEVLLIHGNHDYDLVHTLGVALELLFKDNPNVTIDSSRMARKYLRYGNTLLGFAHGDKQKRKIAEIPLMMAQENAANGDWGASKFRQFYCGDLHHNFTVRSPSTMDYIGVAVKFMRSCGGNDTWHYDSGYIGVTKEMSFDLWTKDRGERSSYKVSI